MHFCNFHSQFNIQVKVKVMHYIFFLVHHIRDKLYVYHTFVFKQFWYSESHSYFTDIFSGASG